jgi:hypothetical protein
LGVSLLKNLRSESARASGFLELFLGFLGKKIGRQKAKLLHAVGHNRNGHGVMN